MELWSLVLSSMGTDDESLPSIWWKQWMGIYPKKATLQRLGALQQCLMDDEVIAGVVRQDLIPTTQIQTTQDMGKSIAPSEISLG